MKYKFKVPKKLIEVALPLDSINAACAYEKQPGIGAHPRGLHWWWARRPLAAARAFLFSQLVNDPGYEDGKGFKRGFNKKVAERKREELFEIIREIVDWKNTDNKGVFIKANKVIMDSWKETCDLNKDHPDAATLFNPNIFPTFHDPFAGGGALPLEAKRLGLKSCATDLNPIPLIINKSMIEIPSRFNDTPPVNPNHTLFDSKGGLLGLADDIEYYGNYTLELIRDKLSVYFPSYKLSDDDITKHPHLANFKHREFTPYTYIWVRTVPSPSPAFNGISVPLASTFAMSTKKGKESYIKPVITNDGYYFTIYTGKGDDYEISKAGTKLGRGAFRCILSDSPIDTKYIKQQGKEGKLQYRLLAIVTSIGRGKIYLPPINNQESIIKTISPDWIPESEICGSSQYIGTKAYGLGRFSDLFTKRQLHSLNVISSCIKETAIKVRVDAHDKLAEEESDTSLDKGGKGATAYSEAITTYLSLAVSRLADFNSQLSTWKPSGEQVMHTFTRQAIPMTWDFAESNILINKGICWKNSVKYVIQSLLKCPSNGTESVVLQQDARMVDLQNKVISTDPPYFDNIPYADLSDYFYVWMRKNLKHIYPENFSTLSVPKMDELVAFAYRHDNDKLAAGSYFMQGMKEFATNLGLNSHPAHLCTIYYAFKQSETGDSGTSSTGWEAFLEALISSNLEIVGTWPARSELSTRIRSLGSNALASSIVLACKKRDPEAESISRRQFQKILRDTLPEALETMIGGKRGSSPIAPVDLAQSSIGPGIAVYSKYASVLNQDGSSMTIYDALILINRGITDYLTPDSGNFDNDTLFCSTWFDQYGWKAGPFGEALVVASGKGTSVDGVQDAGIIESGGGKVRLLKWLEYPDDWDTKQDNRTPVWEALHYLIRALNQNGESESGRILSRMPERAEAIRQLAYHLYTLCERKKWANDARAYNELITSWHGIASASHEAGHTRATNPMQTF